MATRIERPAPDIEAPIGFGKINNRGADVRAAEIDRAQRKHSVWAIAAEFDETEPLVNCARNARNAGYTRMDAYTPMPVEGLSDAIGFRNKQMPALMFCGGLFGCVSAYFMEWFALARSYPLNHGGRPYHSWPNFIVIAFEGTILLTALTGVFGMLILNGLPTYYHPIFNLQGFERSSQDRFFLAIEARDKNFDFDQTMAFLRSQGALRVEVVEK